MQLGQVGRRDGRDVHQPAERGDGRVVGKRRAAGRDHHRIEHDRQARLLGLQPLEPLRDLLGGEGAADHADLHRVDADVADDRVDLREDHLGRNRVDRGDAERVLRGDRGDRGHRVAAEHGDGLDVGLNPRAAARIRAGDDQDAGRRRHATRLRPAPRGEVFHVHGQCRLADKYQEMVHAAA